MGNGISQNQIWRKIINKFNTARLDYIVVGAAALVIYGLPRSTLDIDIYIPAEERALYKLFQIADKLKLKSEQKDILRFGHLPKLFANQWVCFSYKGQDILDVFFAGKKEFRKLYANSELKQDKKFTVRVAALSDISTMKKISGRPVDLADLDLIKEAGRYKK